MQHIHAIMLGMTHTIASIEVDVLLIFTWKHLEIMLGLLRLDPDRCWCSVLMNHAQKSSASPCCSMVKRLLLLLITACMNS